MKKLLLTLAVFLWAGLQLAMAQTRPVKGQVLDDKGEGVPGASVQVKGTTTGTITDVDGNFSLEVPDDQNVLVINAVGFAPQEVKAGDGDNVLSVNLRTTATELQETVVTAQAIRREKRSLGYSTTSVNADELTQGGSISPINSLTGKVAGVNITSTSNTPGASSRIVLRGGSSITGNNQALIVVDGVITNNANVGTQTTGVFGNIGNLTNQVDFGNRGNDINPDDIESITVLKGPAATALYGSKGSNGAIMITTKKGKRREGPSKTEIEFSTSYTVSSVLKYPDFQNEYGQGNIYEGIYDDRRENFSWGEPFNGQNRPWGQIIDGKQRVKPYSALPNNVKDFFNNGKAWSNSLAVNGGTEKTAFRLGLNTLNSSSIFPGKDYNKYGLTFNGSADLSNKFYASTVINYVNINSDLPAFGQGDASILDNLYQTPRDIPIRELRDLNDKFNSMEYLDENGVNTYGFYGAYAKNPYWVAENYHNRNKVDRVFGNVTLGYKPLDWLRIEDRLSVDAYSDRRYQTAAKLNSVAADHSLAWNDQTSPGRYSEGVVNSTNIYNDLMITANKQLTEDITATVLLGHNIQQERTDITYASTNEDGGIVVPGFYDLTNSNGKPLTINTNTLIRRVGIYLDASFGYKNMLFLGFSGRNDWSSTVSKSYFYPSVNGSFVLSELFPESLRNVWNYSKIRMSYGRVGNDAPAYQWYQTYSSAVLNGDFGSLIFPFEGTPGFTYNNRVYNPNLKPEFSSEFEIGTEQSFLNDRIRFDFAYYSKRSEDQIVPISLPFSSGFSSMIINAGLVTNRGIELSARFVPVRTRKVRWELFGTFTKNTNEVKEIYEGTNQISVGSAINGMSVVAATGMPYGTFYTTAYQRSPDGRIVVDSASGIPLKTTSSQFFGSYLPKWQASWGTTFSYMGFSLYVLFDMKKGGQFFSRTRDIMAFVGTSAESGNRDEQVWPNSVYLGSDGQYHTNTTEYLPYQFYTTQSQRPGEFQLVDASYVKLREARLTYTLPGKYLNGTPFGSLSVSIFGNNLFLWTPKENQFTDPELNSNGANNVQGFEFGASPSVRSYGVNLKLTF